MGCLMVLKSMGKEGDLGGEKMKNRKKTLAKCI